MFNTTQQRIISLQRQLKIAKEALTRIANEQYRETPARVAQEALDECGHWRESSRCKD